VADFKAEALSAANGLDTLRVSVEFRRGAAADAAVQDLAGRIKAAFEVTPEIAVLETGTLAREFEGSVKAPRFADRRG
jgi:phenylacetate-CoA ligase